MAGFGASDALVRRRSRRGLAILVALAVPLALASLFSLLDRDDYQIVTAMLVCFEAVCFFLLPAFAPQGVFTGERRGSVRADREGVVFRKKLALRRDQIESVWVEALPEGARRVHLSTRKARDELAIVVEDEARVDVLLEALALHHDRHAASFMVDSGPLRTARAKRIARALALVGAALLTAAVCYAAYLDALFGFALVPVLAAYSFALRAARPSTRVVVGADGLVVRAGGVLRQISPASIRQVTTAAPEVGVELDTGEWLTFRFAGEGEEERSFAFAQRVLAAREQRLRASDAVEALLMPASRSTSEWLDDLRRITSAGSGYRRVVVADEDLWRIASDPASDPGARAGALAALSPRLGEADRVRIGEIAGGTARLDVRAALEAAAAGGLEERILDAFGDHRAPERSRE